MSLTLLTGKKVLLRRGRPAGAAAAAAGAAAAAPGPATSRGHVGLLIKGARARARARQDLRGVGGRLQTCGRLMVRQIAAGGVLHGHLHLRRRPLLLVGAGLRVHWHHRRPVRRDAGHAHKSRRQQVLLLLLLRVRRRRLLLLLSLQVLLLLLLLLLLLPLRLLLLLMLLLLHLLQLLLLPHLHEGRTPGGRRYAVARRPLWTRHTMRVLILRAGEETGSSVPHDMPLETGALGKGRVGKGSASTRS